MYIKNLLEIIQSYYVDCWYNISIWLSTEKLTREYNESVLGHFRGRFANYEDDILDGGRQL